MSQPARLDDFDGLFFKGAKSDSDPGLLPKGFYWMAVNMINTGGVLSTRPGYRCIVSLPDGNLQGATFFRPRMGLEQVVVAISGKIFVAEYPFHEFRLLDNIKLSESAKQVFWCLTEQSVRRTSTEFAAPLKVVVPRKVLFIQDGGLTAPAWYDGSSSGGVRLGELEVVPGLKNSDGSPYTQPAQGADNFGTPTGGPMAWIGDRLWVARGTYVYASDIANPFSFREQQYLGTISAFVLPDEVTALAVTPGSDAPQLLAYTTTNCTLIRASIRNRDLWATTDDMQREWLKIGCPSQRSVVNHVGQLSWFTNTGIVIYDSAVAARHISRIPVRDMEMIVSKSTLSPDLSLVAGGAFQQFLMMSVPAGDIYNTHTWVMNSASIETLNDESGPSWCGYWIGTRPVEWLTGFVAGSEQCYYVSKDSDGANRLWRAFEPDRKDNGCPIIWSVETRGYFGAASQVAGKPAGQDCQFRYVDLSLCGISEDLDLAVFFAPGIRGSYHQILTKRLAVEKGSLRYDVLLRADTPVFAYKPQSRTLRTEDAPLEMSIEETGGCPVEREFLDYIDESHQVMVVGSGVATIRWIRAFGELRTPDFSGDGKACTDETGVRGVRFDGFAAEGNTPEEVISELASKGIQSYEANATVTATQGGQSAVGVGHSESVISQDAADRVAEIIATRQAEHELENLLPKIISAGEDL